MAGIDPDSDGLARARRLKVATTHEGVDGLVALDEFADVRIVFDATSAGAHRRHDEVLRAARPHGHRPHPGRHRPVRRPAGQPRRPPGRAQRQHGDLRRPGHHPGRRRRRRRHPRALRGDRRLHRLPLGRSRHPGQHRRVHRDHRLRHRAGRRRGPGQGDHRPQPGRAPADHAGHRALPGLATATTRRSPPPSRRWSAVSRRTCPGYRLKQKVQFDRVADRRPAARACCPPAVGTATRAEGVGLPGGRGRRPLPARLRRKPRHHDLGRAAHRGAHGRTPLRGGGDHDDPAPCTSRT